jgi:hypothetical protein
MVARTRLSVALYVLYIVLFQIFYIDSHPSVEIFTFLYADVKEWDLFLKGYMDDFTPSFTI